MAAAAVGHNWLCLHYSIAAHRICRCGCLYFGAVLAIGRCRAIRPCRCTRKWLLQSDCRTQLEFDLVMRHEIVTSVPRGELEIRGALQMQPVK